MNAATKTILALAVMGAAAFAVVKLMSTGEVVPPPTITEAPPPIVDPQDPKPPSTGNAQVDPGAAVQQPNTGRTTVDPGANLGAALPQGVRGRVVDAGGAAFAGVQVTLRKVVPGGIFGTVIRQQQGLGNAPISTAITDAQGAFSLGVSRVEAEPLEMWFTGLETVDQSLPLGPLKANEWKEVGDVTLKRGCVLFGQVFDETTGQPIAGAIVHAKNPTIGGLSPAPGRDDGVPATTDATGRYRFDNIAEGALMVWADAEGFARVTDHDIRVSPQQAIEKVFRLPIGMSIGGVVTDAEGNGVANAEVSAVCLSTKTPMRIDVRTDGSGKYAIAGLVDAPFQLNAAATGFLRATVQPVAAGTSDQQIVLERQGGAKVRVVGADGRLIKTFWVTPLRHFAQNNQFGPAHDIPTRQVHPRDLDADGAYEITGMNPGDYGAEINADGFAKTRSAPFKVAANEPSVVVEVRMQNGGRIEGTVLGPDGQPLAGVDVETLPPQVIEVPFLRDMVNLMATEVTKQQTKTGANGRYRFEHLAGATYQVKFSHPSSYVKYVRDVVVADEQTTDIETVKLERGTRVHGVIRVDGKPEAGVKVSITSAAEPGTDNVATMMRFADETVTNERGEYEFPRRVPPGSYTLRAGRQTGANPLLVMLDYKKSEQTTVFSSEDAFDYSPNIQTTN